LTDFFRIRRSELSCGPRRIFGGPAQQRQPRLRLTELLPESLHCLRACLDSLT